MKIKTGGGFMQQKMQLVSICPGNEPPEVVLCRGLLLAFAEAGLLTAEQVRDALRRIERAKRP
jgi:hypothetical protein